MSNSSSKEPDTSLFNFALPLLILCIAGYVIWHFFKVPILEFMRYVRLAELWVIGLFTNNLDSCYDWLKAANRDDHAPSTEMVGWTNACFHTEYLATVPRDQLGDYFMLSVSAMSMIETMIIPYMRWPVAAVFIGLGIYIMFYSPRAKFRTRHTLESFIKVQAKMWPVISPIVKFNPTKSSARMLGSAVPDKLPIFAEALSPEEWIAWHRIPVTNGIADREATRRAFVLQLGPRWNGIEGQPDHIRSLFAVFSLKGVQKREASDDMLGRISLCWSEKGGLKLTSELQSEIRDLLRDPEVGGKGLEVARDFAWRTTAMIGVLRWARSMGGVLAPAQFLWLRGTDRNLWYALNNLGRRSFHSEGAGAMAHFMVEQNAKKPLPIPRVDTAIVTLNQYLAETGRIIPPREEPKSKRGR